MFPTTLLLVAHVLAFSVVTSIPLTNQEKLVNVEKSGQTVDRAKRANEEIVFGNQQNKARVVAKKSDLSHILSPPDPEGERDHLSEVIVHKETPVSEELVARAEASLGSARENNQKMKDAMEAAIQSVQESADQDISNKVDSEVQQLADDVVEDSDDDQNTPEEVVDSAPEDRVEEDGDSLDTTELTDQSSDLTPADQDDQTAEIADSSDPDQDVHEFLQGAEKSDSEVSLDRDREKSYYRDQLRNYLMAGSNGRAFPGYQPFPDRFRRSSSASKGHKRARRIKRDLLDDYYGLNRASYNPSPDTEEEEVDPEDGQYEKYAPLSEDEALYLLLNYLKDGSNQEQELTLDQPSLDSYLDGYSRDREETYVPYQVYGGDQEPSFFQERIPDNSEEVDSYRNYDKRGMVDYYPFEEEKRYFFPFNKEPETHWGAFVPEKRDYGEAIQRLQRLAMALSDNPGPYYREMLEQYERK